MSVTEDCSQAGGLAVDFAITAAKKIAHTARNRDERAEGEWRGSFYFVQAADTQLGMIANFDESLTNPSTSNEEGEKNNSDKFRDPAIVHVDWRKEVFLMRRLIVKVNLMKPRPRFLIVCGDLIDAMPGVPYRVDQIRDFKAILSTLDPSIRAICICGNHDIGNTPTPQSIDEYKAEFGDDYFTFWVGGCKFVVVNSQLYQDNSQTAKELRVMDKWLDEELGIASTSNSESVATNSSLKGWKHLIGFQHVAPFLFSRDEPACSVFGDYRWCFNYGTLATRFDYLDRLKAAGMTKLFCGHYHRNAGGWDESLEVIVTSAVGCQLSAEGRSGARIVRVLPNRVDHVYFALDDLPSTIELGEEEGANMAFKHS